MQHHMTLIVEILPRYVTKNKTKQNKTKTKTKTKQQQKQPGKIRVKGCGMGPMLVLVSPCFRENVVATCKIGSFLCSLDNLLQKNLIFFFFGNEISK